MAGITEQDRWEWIECYAQKFARVWRFEWGAVGWAGGDSTVLEAMWAGVDCEYYATSPAIQIINSAENIAQDVAALDRGEDPTCGWEDGMGHIVDKACAAVCDADGEPKRWIVEDVAEDRGGETFVSYFHIQAEANAAAMNQWLHLTPGERRTRHIYVGYDKDGTYAWSGDLYMPDGCWDSANLDDGEDRPREITAVKRIAMQGTSLSVNATAELKAMGLGRGDLVRVTFERMD